MKTSIFEFLHLTLHSLYIGFTLLKNSHNFVGNGVNHKLYTNFTHFSPPRACKIYFNSIFFQTLLTRKTVIKCKKLNNSLVTVLICSSLKMIWSVKQCKVYIFRNGGKV